VLGHEAIGIVLEVGRESARSARRRVVVPFQISCGYCWMCERSLYTQCETTQVRGEGSGAALFGYSKLYGQVPGAQAEYLRIPKLNSLTSSCLRAADDRFIYLSDVLPTAWQAVEYAGVPDGGSC
jgi:threonine dehydrogenase-like Zn-dependent dehydrogenase